MMRFETWQIGDTIITIRKEERLVLTCNDDKVDSFLSYIGYNEAESFWVSVDVYDELQKKEGTKILTWFDLPDEDDEDYE